MVFRYFVYRFHLIPGELGRINLRSCFVILSFSKISSSRSGMNSCFLVVSQNRSSVWVSLEEWQARGVCVKLSCFCVYSTEAFASHFDSPLFAIKPNHPRDTLHTDLFGNEITVWSGLEPLPGKSPLILCSLPLQPLLCAAHVTI